MDTDVYTVTNTCTLNVIHFLKFNMHSNYFLVPLTENLGLVT